jgi:hypothetical protein
MDSVLTANVVAHQGTVGNHRSRSRRPRPRVVSLPSPALKDRFSPRAG